MPQVTVPTISAGSLCHSLQRKSTKMVGAVTPAVVSELDRAEWCTLSTMRRAALLSDPDAFMTTWATESRLSEADWRSRFTASVWFVARDGAHAVGIACLAPPEPRWETAYFLESAWVRLSYRRRGVLRQMIAAVEHRARAAGAIELRLWVLDTNESAALAYLKLGFGPFMNFEQETTKVRADGEPVKERLMWKQLVTC